MSTETPVAERPADPPPTAADQAAAHHFLTELRTRITTQPLPYQHGVEARALESMWQVFVQAREAIKKHPGCHLFARRATEVLNIEVRPLTAKWHRAFEEGRLAGRDGADEFRGELQDVQARLRAFATELHAMAYGAAYDDALTPDVMSEAALDALLAPLPFGFTGHTEKTTAVQAQIRRDENEAVLRRRSGTPPDQLPPADARAENAVGLALSGGGIRSATFCLGVAQVLAARGLLGGVDILSTVSGGGYTGCFLTRQLGAGAPASDVGAPHGPDSEPVRYVRQHARFLSVSNLKDKWAMVTATLAGMLLNWTAPLLVILLLAIGAHWLSDNVEIHWPTVLQACAGLCVAAMVIYGAAMRAGRKAALATGTFLGLSLAATGLLAVGMLVEWAFPRLLEFTEDHFAASGGLATALAAVAAAAPGIIRFLPVLKDPALRKIVLQVALVLAALLVPFIALLLFYTFRGLAAQHSPLLLWIAAALAVVSLVILNINLTAPHRMYRDGLARTFIQKSETDAPDAPLAAINPTGAAPYHLINAALNVPASVDSALKDRGCDFFLFSKHWMGAPSIDYQRTADWKANGGDVDLATAMAVSGAAFSSYMGLGSKPMLTALLTMLNVRLGFWIRKPGTGFTKTPGFRCLLREMTGLGMSERADWLNLSDGGHIENLAIYELLRRRCKFIVCVDGEADPDFTFHGLMTLVRHAQIDFGVRITPQLDDVRPDPATGRSKCHFHLCRIHYPEGTGLLLYLKLSVTGNESELIRRYRTNHPEFPHQTTLDQFFDQEQFEAYRQLGVHAAEGLFLPALLNRARPTTIPEWFRALAKNLLEPGA